ncbi:RNA polymerase sigma factor [Mesorhizobium sp. M0898]|uniref:RNA polymerase sigma factor n=1 Tax=Mesorhizobium sp. M0898 TaxID=2957020 RepID=UPI00333ABDF1
MWRIFARTLVALDQLRKIPQLRPWFFRIAHTRALDLLRSRAMRAAEPIEAALELVVDAAPDPVKILMRQEAIQTGVSRSTELPILQRSVIILKDVLDEPLTEIAGLLDITVDTVKGRISCCFR